jgi:hypothetical protein
VLLLISDGDDGAAQQFADDLRRTTVVLQPPDLCVPGWRYDPGNPDDARVVAGAAVHPVSDLDAIVCALPLIRPATLTFVHEDDQAYVAAELTAMLTAILATVRCPVLNPPRGGCLCGPGWPPETWAVLASQAGVPTWPLRRAPELKSQSSRRTASPEAGETEVVVTVCGRQVVERDADETLVEQALTLAESSGVPLLTTKFRRRGGVPLLTGVLPWPDLARPGLAAAVSRHLEETGA